MAAACIDLGIPIVLHCSEPVGHDYPGKGTATPGHVAAFAMRNPALQLVCAHLGGGLPFYAHMPEVAELCRRLWFDTAAGPFLFAPTAYRAVADLCGADRLLFGSDHPLLPARRYIDAFAQAELTVAERDLVMGGNAVRPAWSVTPCPSRYTSVSQHRRLRSEPFGTLLRAEKPAPASRSFASFVTRIGGFGPRPWSQPTLR